MRINGIAQQWICADLYTKWSTCFDNNMKPQSGPEVFPCWTLVPHSQHVLPQHPGWRTTNLTPAGTETTMVGWDLHQEKRVHEVQINAHSSDVPVTKLSQVTAECVWHSKAIYFSKSASFQTKIENCNTNTTQIGTVAQSGLATWLPEAWRGADLKGPEYHIVANHAPQEVAECLWLSRVWDTLLGITKWSSLPQNPVGLEPSAAKEIWTKCSTKTIPFFTKTIPFFQGVDNANGSGNRMLSTPHPPHPTPILPGFRQCKW